MTSDHPSPACCLIITRTVVCSIWIALLVCLLLFAFTGDAAAASGSTRLTIHIDQSVVDAIARWKGEMVQPPATPTGGEAGQVLQRLLPALQIGLEKTLHPLSVQRILQHLEQDTLIVFESRAEHTGSSGACVSDKVTDGFLTVHSI